MIRNVFLSLLVLAASVFCSVETARAGSPTQTAVVLSGAQDAYPTSNLALDFVGTASAGSPFYKSSGVIAGSCFACLPGVTVTRASGGYAEDQTGALIWFNSGQARITNKGLLLEEARTNLVLQSQTLDNLTWSQSNASTTPDAVVAPDGTLTADQLVESSGTSTHSWQQTITKAASSLTYTASGYFKYNGRGITLVVRDSAANANRASVGVNLQTGAVAGAATASGTFTSASGTAIAIANGWYRVTLTFTTSTETSLSLRLYADSGAFGTDGQSYTGNGTSGFYGWGAQLEQAAFSTSYMPTTSASATRPADLIFLSGVTGATQGTWLLDFQSDLKTVTGRWVAYNFSDGGYPTGTGLEINTNAAGAVSFGGNGSAVNTAPNLPVANITNRIVTTWNVTGAIQRSSLNGLPANGNTTLDYTATGVSRLALGSLTSSVVAGSPNGYLQRFVVYPQFSSDAAMQALSAGPDVSSLNLNFAAGSYRALVNGAVVQSTNLSNFATATGYTLTATRASTAYASDSGGNLILFGTNVPRITDQGLLVEEARTNLATASQTFTTNWAGNPIVPNVTLAPDGTLTGGKLAEMPAASGLQTQSAFVQVTASGSTTYSHAIYAKAEERNWLYLRQYDATNNSGAWFNLNTCTVGTKDAGVTAFATPAANGWCRAVITFTSAAGATLNRVQAQIATGDGVSGIRVGDGVSGFDVWQADLQAGSFITSPIPTTSVGATRPADVISLALNVPGAFTYGMQVVPNTVAAGTFPYSTALSDGSNNNRFELFGSSTSYSGLIVAGGVTQYTFAVATDAVGTVGSDLVSVNGTTVLRSLNGATQTGAVITTSPAGAVNQLQFKSGSASAYFRRVTIYPYAANQNEANYRTAGNF